MTASSLGPYAVFIIGAYGVTTLIIAGLIAWIALDYRRQSRALAELEARGIKRRSERRDEATS